MAGGFCLVCWAARDFRRREGLSTHISVPSLAFSFSLPNRQPPPAYRTLLIIFPYFDLLFYLKGIALNFRYFFYCLLV